MLDPLRPQAVLRDRAARLLRKTCLLVPILFLALTGACSRHHNTASDPGTPPVITAGPIDATTVTGRPISFSITVTGAATLRFQWAKDGSSILGALGSTYTIPNPKLLDAGAYTVTVTNPNGTVTSSAANLTVQAALTFTTPTGITSDATGNLFVSDPSDHSIWKVDTTNHVTLLAGSSGNPGSTDGKGSGAQFRNPGAIALDPAGNLVVADTGNHTIRRIAPDGTVTTLAGSPGISGSTNDIGTLARFNSPNGLAVDGIGAIYIADTLNHSIRLLATNGAVTTYAGTPGTPGQANGSGSTAQFDQPCGLALAPTGVLYVADYGNSAIRIIAPSAQVGTLAGKPGTFGFNDGTGLAALFDLPMSLTLDSTGALWVADTHNHSIRHITPDGLVALKAGSGSSGNMDGTSSAALFNLPCGITTLPSGNMVVADTYNHILRLVTPAGVVTTLTFP
jgi:sugar lactone lactonase YvrE